MTVRQPVNWALGRKALNRRTVQLISSRAVRIRIAGKRQTIMAGRAHRYIYRFREQILALYQLMIRVRRTAVGHETRCRETRVTSNGIARSVSKLSNGSFVSHAPDIASWKGMVRTL